MPTGDSVAWNREIPRLRILRQHFNILIHATHPTRTGAAGPEGRSELSSGDPDRAAPRGVSVPTITQWLGVLETTARILIIPPFYENPGKRLIKSPKVYLTDSGLACHLLGIDSAAELTKSPFAGSLFEGFIASEIVKTQVNAGGRRELYHFRDEQGLEGMALT